MRADDLLVLDYAGFSRHTALFYKKLEAASFRELFVRDPAGVLFDSLFPGYKSPTPGKINQANRMLFSLLSNPKFMDWSKGFQKKLEETAQRAAPQEKPGEAIKLYTVQVDRAKLYQEILEATRSFADVEFFHSAFIADPDDNPCGTVPRPIPLPNPPQPPVPWPDISIMPRFGGNEDVAVEVETLIYAVAVAAVAVVVTVVAVAGMPAVEILSRQDLAKVTGIAAEHLQARAQGLRESGKLTSHEAIRGRLM